MLDQIPNKNQTPPTSPGTQAAPSAPVAGPVPIQNTNQIPAQPTPIRHGSPKKGVIISLVIFLLLIGGSAAAYFSGAYLKLSFFDKKVEEIKEEKIEDFTALIFDNLVNLKGADFELTLKSSTQYLDKASDADSVNEEVSGLSMLGAFDDMEVEMNISGSSFTGDPATTSDDAVQISISGSDKSEEMKFGADFRYVSNTIFYRISENPLLAFFDITKGHMNEWIKISLDEEIDNYIAVDKDDSEENLKRYNRLVSEARKRSIFKFQDTGNNVNVKGTEAKLVDVSINARELMDYFEVVKDIGLEAIKEDKLEDLDIPGEDITPEQKEKVIEGMQKFMKDIKISLAIDMATANLMMLDIEYSSTSVSYDDREKKDTVSVVYKIFNHNNPTKVEVPEEYIDQEDIDRESMGMDEVQYNDFKQAEKINDLRLELANYYYENRAYPNDLADLSINIKDLNTAKDYVYVASKANYSLTYEMNTDISKLSEDTPTEDTLGYDDWGIDNLANVNLGTNTLDNGLFDFSLDNNGLGADYYLENALVGDVFGNNSLWVKGQNKADRFSPVASQYKNSIKLIKDTSTDNYNDLDALMSVTQVRLLTSTKAWLNNYYREKNKYPESLLDLKEFVGTPFSSYGILEKKGPEGFVCEDLYGGGYCDYSVEDDGQDYSIKINFDIDYNNINSDSIKYSTWNRSILTGDSIYFVKGENIFTSQVVVDSDRDGLSDRDEEKYGTDKNKYDTDGDGYSDGEEIFNGYDPLTK